MTAQEVFAPQTCTSRDQVAKAVSSPRKVHLPMAHFTSTGKIRTSSQGRPQGQIRSSMNNKKGGALFWEGIQGLLRTSSSAEHPPMLAQQESILEMGHWPPIGSPSLLFLQGLCLAFILSLIQYCTSAGGREYFFFFQVEGTGTHRAMSILD